MTEQSTPGNSAPVPDVVGRYAAYLRAKTHVTAEITMGPDRADVRVSSGDAALALIFRRRGENEWELRSAEVQRGAQTAAFARGQVAKATVAFLGDEPLTPPFPSRKAQACLPASTPAAARMARSRPVAPRGACAAPCRAARSSR